jgi:hypothetical protein
MRATLSLWPETESRDQSWGAEFDVAAGIQREHTPETPAAPNGWRDWLRALFPSHIRAGFARRHEEFWEWLWSITPESAPRPFVGIWPRGGAKSTSAELGAPALGLRGRRRYGLYVRDTQDRADDSVSNVAALLESEAVQRYYPEHAERLVGKYGNSQGWRRNRIRTAGGFTLDALGLDVAGRGVKLLEQRPDFMIFDDIDARHDSPKQTEKKLATIKDSLLPAGTANCAVIAIQNLIIPNGIFSRIVDGRADMLTRRLLSGPEPALRNMKTERVRDPETGGLRAVITAGEPTWQGQDRQACQQLVDLIGLDSFNREAQHQVQEREGALWTRDVLNATRVAKCPLFKRVVVGVDPSGGGEEIGIIVGGLGYDNHGYIFDDQTAKGALGPRYWARQTANAYHDHKADRVVAEVNFGGDMVEANIKVADKTVPVKVLRASRGKAQRAEPVSTLFSEERAHLVGAFPELETELTSWVPGDADSPNRLDAMVWVLTELMLDLEPRPEVTVIG